MTGRLLVLLLCWLIAAPGRGQDPRQQALEKQLQAHPQADTVRATLLAKLGYEIRSTQTGRALQLAQEARQLAQRLNDKRAEAYANYVLGATYDVYLNSSQALPFLQRSLALYRQLNDRTNVASLLSQIGVFHTRRGDLVLALSYSLRAQRQAERLKDTTLLARTTARLGSLYVSLGAYQQALTMESAAIDFYEQLGNQEELCRVLNAFGEIFREQGDFEQAERFYTKAIRVATTIDKPILVAQSESNLAQTYAELGNYAEATTTANHALTVLTAANQTSVVAWTLSVLADIYYRQQQLELALVYALQGWKLSQQIDSRESLRGASRMLSLIYAARRQYPEAYAYQQRYTAYKDTLEGKNTQQQLALLQYNYGLAEKQNQIALLRKDSALQAENTRRQQQVLVAALVGMAVVLVLLGLVYRNYRQKQKANLILEKQKLEIQQQRDQINRTLTELKNTQNQLIHSEKMASLGELTAGIAHEIQNPLNFVNNFAEVSQELTQELLDEQKKGPARDAELEAELLTDLSGNLEKIAHHGHRASGIVKGMLDHSRMSTGRKETVHLNDLCEEYLRLAYQGIRAKDKAFNAELTTDFDPKANEIQAVPQDIGRVLLNLFANAFQAVQERQEQHTDITYKPHVGVRTRKEGRRVIVRIRDNGTGVSEALQQKIFQPFFTTKPTGKGTGLGLSLSYDIVTNGHGGALTLESKPGEGATFVMTLPA